MAGLIGAGQGLRNLANQGMAKVASADAQAAVLREQEEMANEAGEKQLLGTAGGIGGMIGAPKALGMAKDVKVAKDLAATTQGTFNTATSTFEAADALNKTAQTAETVAALGEATAGVEAAATAAGVAEAGATSAAATGGTLAQLSAVAAPIAIALGVGFLINKLF